MRKTIVLGLLSLGVLLPGAFPAPAQHIEAFGGYSFSSNEIAPTRINLHGWQAMVSVGVWRWVGLTADFSGAYGSPTIGTTQRDTNIHTFLFGPSFATSAERRLRLVVHPRIGVARGEATGTGPNFNETGLAGALGAALDVKLIEHVFWRVGQADYLVTRLPNLATGQTETQSNTRYATGLVIRFGRN